MGEGFGAHDLHQGQATDVSAQAAHANYDAHAIVRYFDTVVDAQNIFCVTNTLR